MVIVVVVLVSTAITIVDTMFIVKVIVPKWCAVDVQLTRYTEGQEGSAVYK